MLFSQPRLWKMFSKNRMCHKKGWNSLQALACAALCPEYEYTGKIVCFRWLRSSAPDNFVQTEALKTQTWWFQHYHEPMPWLSGWPDSAPQSALRQDETQFWRWIERGNHTVIFLPRSFPLDFLPVMSDIKKAHLPCVEGVTRPSFGRLQHFQLFFRWYSSYSFCNFLCSNFFLASALISPNLYGWITIMLNYLLRPANTFAPSEPCTPLFTSLRWKECSVILRKNKYLSGGNLKSVSITLKVRILSED